MTEKASLIRQAQQAIQAGETDAARQLLRSGVRRYPEEYALWLLLASVTADPQQALAYVERAAALEPNSATVNKARAWAQKRIEKAATLSPASADSDEGTGFAWRRWALGGALVLILLAAALSGLFWQRGAEATAVAPAASSPEETPAAVAAAPSRTAQAVAPTATAVPPTVTPPSPQLQAKAIGRQDRPPLPTWTLTPTPTSTPLPSPTPAPTFLAPDAQGPAARPFGVGPNERWIDVNLTTQTLIAFEGDTPALTTNISSGTWQYPTVTGQFRIYIAYESQTMDGRRLGYDYYLPNVPYVMYFYEDYALHGTYWHNNFGTPMSHGCVNMRTEEAEWVYQWASIGTVVNVHY